MLNYIFLIAILLSQVASQGNLQSYGNGNFGAGLNNNVSGVNNTWNGTKNNINGSQNTVKGNQNRVNGQKNYVQGNNNTIGNLSPQQVAKLQNQMAEKLQRRFSSLGFFNNPTTKSSLSKQPMKSEQKADIPSSSLPKQQDKHNQQVKQKQVNQASVKPQKQQVQKTYNQENNSNNSTKKNSFDLIFRTYGKQQSQDQVQDWFNQKFSQEHRKQLFLIRFGKKSLKNRRIFYSSIFKQVSSSFEL